MSTLTTSDLESLYRTNTAHPNPMFDFLTGFVPRRLRDLFTWMEYLYYNSAQIFAGLKKFSEYPITNISYSTQSHGLEERLKTLLEKTIKAKNVLILCGRDRWVYGNSFVSVYQPFARFLKCPSCNKLVNIEHVEYKFRYKQLAFEYFCKKCKQTVKGKVIDRKITDPERIHVIRWDPKQMDIDYNPITGKSEYYYTVPPHIKDRIRKGNKLLLNTMPLSFLKAARDNKMYKFAPGYIYHMKVEAPAGIEQQWGFPPLTSAIKLFFHVATLRKANEAIALEHLVPFDVISPKQNSASADPLQTIALGRFMDNIKTGIRKHRRDPLHKITSPIPVEISRLGGDGRAMLTVAEVKEANDEIVASMGIPREFIFGGLCCDSEELAVTAHGLVPLRTLAPETANRTHERVLTVDTLEGPHPTTFAHNVGLKAPMTLRTQRGYTLTGAATHPVAVLQPDLTIGYKKFEDLDAGDYAVRRFGTELWATEPCPLPPAPVPQDGGSQRRRTDVTYPTHTSPELARLLGYLVSEGSIDEERVRLGNTDPDFIKDYVSCFEKVFHITPNVYPCPAAKETYRNSWSAEVGSRDLVQWLKQIGFDGSSLERHIPWCILQAPRDHVSFFMRAYYEGDGSVCIKPDDAGSVVGYTSSPHLAKELQIVLQNAGVESSIYPPTKASPTHKVAVHKQLRQFAAFAGFCSRQKQQRLAGLVEQEIEEANSAAIPYVREAVALLKQKHPCSCWKYDKVCPPLEAEVYTAKSAALALGTTHRVILTAISEGKLPSEMQGRCRRIYAKDLRTWCETHGVPHREKGQTWPRFYKQNVSLAVLRDADLTLVQKHAPELVERIQRLCQGDLRFDPIVAVGEGEELIPMSDLTVPGPACYTAGGLVCHNSFTGSAITLRMLENQLLTYTSELNELLQWITDKVTKILGWASCDVELTEFKLIDDVQQKQLLLQLNQNSQLISNTTIAEMNDFDLSEERDRRMQEALDEVRFQQKLNLKIQKLQQSLAQQSQQQSMLGQGLMYDQQQVIAQADSIAQQLLSLDPGMRKSQLHSLQVEDQVMYSVVIQRLEQMQTTMQQQAKSQASGGGGGGGGGGSGGM